MITSLKKDLATCMNQSTESTDEDGCIFVYNLLQDPRQSGADIPVQLIEYKPDDYFTEDV